MSVGLYSHTTRGTGTTLTAAIYNSDHVNHITNQNPSMTGAHSDDVTQMRATSDPGGIGTEVLASSLAVELEQIRFAIKRIIAQAQWYAAPDATLGDLGSALIGTFPELKITADLTPAQITSNQNNYAPTGHATAFAFRLSTDADRSITGLAGGSPGRFVLLQNIGAAPISLENEDAASTAANRFQLGNSDIFMLPGEAILLRYDGTSQRWRSVSSVDLRDPDFFSALFNGYTDYTENGSPGNPAANRARLYALDVGGNTRMAYRDSGGNEVLINTPVPAPTVSVFTSGGTWNKPARLSAVIVHVVGGGGDAGSGGGNGGGSSSFGAHCSATGGSGNAGAAGIGSGGDVNLAGERGLAATAINGTRGAGPFGGGPAEGATGANYGGGSFVSGTSGSGGGYSMKRIAAASLGSSESVTVGAGGDGVGGISSPGAPGIVVVEEFYA